MCLSQVQYVFRIPWISQYVLILCTCPRSNISLGYLKISRISQHILKLCTITMSQIQYIVRVSQDIREYPIYFHSQYLLQYPRSNISSYSQCPRSNISLGYPWISWDLPIYPHTQYLSLQYPRYNISLGYLGISTDIPRYPHTHNVHIVRVSQDIRGYPNIISSYSILATTISQVQHILWIFRDIHRYILIHTISQIQHIVRVSQDIRGYPNDIISSYSILVTTISQVQHIRISQDIHRYPKISQDILILTMSLIQHIVRVSQDIWGYPNVSSCSILVTISRAECPGTTYP